MPAQVRTWSVEFPLRAARCARWTTSRSNRARAKSSAWWANRARASRLTGAAIIGLLEPPGRIASGQILLEGQRIDELPYDQMRRIRGRQGSAPIFQDPLTSLNPLYTIGRQLGRNDPDAPAW
jgi:peptide/nickel transport system ATP-binding protein